MSAEAPRARAARLCGEAAYRVMLRGLADGGKACARRGVLCSLHEPIAAECRRAIDEAASAGLTDEQVERLDGMPFEDAIAHVREIIEPDIRRRLAQAGRLPS